MGEKKKIQTLGFHVHKASTGTHIHTQFHNLLEWQVMVDGIKSQRMQRFPIPKRNLSLAIYGNEYDLRFYHFTSRDNDVI